MNCSTNIREARKSKNLTQTQLANLINKGLSTVQKYELGLSVPSLDVLNKISGVLGVSVGYLLYGADFLLYGAGDMLTYEATRIGQAYEKATPPVQRTVEVALEPYMEKSDASE